MGRRQRAARPPRSDRRRRSRRSVPEKPILVDWFEAARTADPDATLYLNEYDIVNGFDPGKENCYAELVAFLLREGADLGGLGMQAHHFEDLRQTPEDVLDVCDTLSDMDDVELAVTEYNTPGVEDVKTAEYLHPFLKTFFSYPATERFIVWGFWDGAHWADDAPLLRADWEKKPAYEVYTGLVFVKWWTDESGTTNDEGRYVVRAFLGEHDVEVRTDEVVVIETVSMTDPDTPTTVEVDATE